MYARVTLLRIGPGRRELAARLSAGVRTAFAGEPGFRDAVFMSDAPGGEWGCVSYWETGKQAGAARDALGEVLKAALEGAHTLEVAPNERIMEVLEVGG